MGLGSAVKYGLAWCAPRVVVISGSNRIRRSVALSFDDGPHPENTPRILDTLSAHGATGTFFVQGCMAAKHPALVRDIVRRGHEIANHGYSHEDARKTPTRPYVSSVLRTQAVLEDIIGTELHRAFRPPYGAVRLCSFGALVLRGYQFVFWSLDSRDSYVLDACALTKYVASLRIQANSILLFHDDYGHTAEALPAIVAHIEKQGLKSTSIGDLLK